MWLPTLLILGIVIELMNRSHYLRNYRVTKLPRLGTLVILMTPALALVDHQIGERHLRLAWLILLALGGLAVLIDLEHHLLPSRLILPSLLLSVLLVIVGGNLRTGIIGAAGWSASFAALAIINPNGLGWGDVKFAALLGFNCGAADLKLVLVAAFLALTFGGAAALYLVVRRSERGRHSEIPFGPFMLAGAIVSLFGA
jgi:leader peptidase (prepilin peptidase)/N-methyltransferase